MCAIDLESRRRLAEAEAWPHPCNDNAARPMPWRQAARFIFGAALGAWCALGLLALAVLALLPA